MELRPLGRSPEKGFNKMKSVLATLGCVLSFAGITLTSVASAEIIEFEDVDLGGEASLPNPYVIGEHRDFYFANFGCYDDVLIEEAFGFSGYSNGAVSGLQAAYQVYAQPSSIVHSDGYTTLFDLESASFTAAWREGVQLRVRGFLGAGNEEVYDQTFTIGIEPTFIELGISAVSAVTFETFGGSDAGFALDGTNFIMDDVDLTVVPTPPVFATLLLAGIGVRRRRTA